MSTDDLDSLIESSSRARFASGVLEDVVVDAEAVLGVRLPDSYRRWLLKYGSGYLGGYELQGLHPVKPSERDPEEHFVGDVVATALRNRAEGAPAHLIELLNYEGDEVYYLDLSRSQGPESPVVCQDVTQPEVEQVASSFEEFLRSQL